MLVPIRPDIIRQDDTLVSRGVHFLALVEREVVCRLERGGGYFAGRDIWFAVCGEPRGGIIDDAKV
jgi:hypothetical protein